MGIRLKRAATYRLVPFGTVGHELRRHEDVLEESDAEPQPLRRAFVDRTNQYLAVERAEHQQPVPCWIVFARRGVGVKRVKNTSLGCGHHCND